MTGAPVDLLLSGGTVITMDRERAVLADGAVAVAGDRIVDVGPAELLRARHAGARRTLDCAGKLVVPGLIDAHGHAGHSLIKTLGCDTPTFWMRIVTPAYFHYTTADFWYADGLLSALERLRAGVTCGVSVMGSRPRSDDPAFAAGHARGYARVGLREVVCVGPSGLPDPHPVSRWVDGVRYPATVGFEEMLATAEAVIESCDGAAGGLISVFLTPFTIVPSVDPSHPSRPDVATALTDQDRYQARRVREVAAAHRVRIHSDAFGGMVRMAAQDPEHALLGPDVHLQHCVGLSLEEVEILAATGTHVGHAPGGRAPVLPMLAAGVNVAITTDGTAPRRPFDLLQAARGVQAAHQQAHDDPYLLPPGRLLEMVTVDAARALGLDHEIGSLEVGKKADLAVLDLRQPHLVPNWMPVHRLMYEAVGRDVETVVVDGRVVLENRQVPGVDETEVLRAAEHEAWALVERAGLRAHLTPPGWGLTRREFDHPVPLPVV